MSALSTSTIAASSSATTAAAKADPRDAGADTSPFAILLAATLQDAPAPQPQIATAPAATDRGTPAATMVDSEFEATQVASPLSAPASDDSSDVVRSGGKRDKKADTGKSKDADPSANDPQALQTAQTLPVPPGIQPVVPPVVQAALQPSQTNNDAGDSDDSADLASAISSAAAASAKNTGNPARPVQAGNNNSAAKSTGDKTADPQTSSQPATAANDDAEQAVPAPTLVQASIVSDDSSAGTDTEIAQIVSSQLAANAKTGTAATQTTAGTSSAGQSVDMSVAKAPATNRSVAGQSTITPPVTDKTGAQQASSQVPSDDDVQANTQNATGPAPIAPDQTAQIAINAATSSAQDDDASTDAAQASAPDVKNAAQANKPGDKQVQPASAVSNQSLVTAPQAPQSATATTDAGGKEAGTDKNFAQTLASDAKSTHAADATPQPVLAAPPIHSAPPANIAPQGVTVADTSGANQPTGTGNTAVTASVHLANAGADPTPDTNALAVSVAARSLSGAKQFDIRLDPAELGRVEVRLSIDASGKTQAHMTADQPQTLALLQKDAPNLTQALRDAGLDVSQGGLNFSLRGQDREGGDKNNSAGQGRRTNLTATRAIGAAQGPIPISYNGAAAEARVDIHV